MHRGTRTLLVSATAAALAGACSPGEVADVAPPDVERVECTNELEITGRFATSISPPPTAAEGCVPEGTWTVDLTEVPGGECASAKYQARYVITIAGQGRDRSYTLTNPEGTAERKFGLSAGGGGECELTLEELSPATAPKYHRLLLKPFTEPGTAVIAGSATYTLWSSKP